MSEQNTLKILVTGAFSSGKTQFCETLTDNDRREIIDTDSELVHSYWHFEIDKAKALQVFDTVGSRRFDFMWEILADNERGKFFGFVVLIDSARTEAFRESNSIIQTFIMYAPAPFVIAATKQDLEGAWDVESLRIVLRIPPEIPIIPCVATDKKSVANVLLALCEEVLRDINAEVEA